MHDESLFHQVGLSFFVLHHSTLEFDIWVLLIGSKSVILST